MTAKQRDPNARLAILVEDGRYELVEAADVYHVEADGHDSLVRTRRRQPRRSLERLSELGRRLGPPFVRCHRSWIVNLDRVREIRRRDDGRGWEVKLDPPVNAVIPVGRSHLAEIFRRLGVKG